MATLALLVFILMLAQTGATPKPVPAPGAPPPPPPPPPLLNAPPPTVSPAVLTPVSTPPAWPQVVPAGLPPFPGPDWVADEPPGPGVVSRAWSLLKQLWASGAGTFKTEKTSGRWITYRATPMGSKKGVVAFRLRQDPKPDSFLQV